MAESIKKRYRLIIIALLILIAIPLTGIILLRLPAVQTRLAVKLTSGINETTGFNISVGKIHLKLIKSINIEHLLVTDSGNDTLIYAREIRAGIRKIGLKDKAFSLGKLNIADPLFRIASDSSGSSNLNEFLSALSRDTLKKESSKAKVSINQIDISNGIFVLANPAGSGQLRQSGIDFSNLVISGINAVAENFVLSNDTTSLSVYRASFSERSGMAINNFSADIKISRGLIGFDEIGILTAASSLNASHISLSYDTPEAFTDFAHNVRMRYVVNNSIIDFRDLGYFIGEQDFNPGPVGISGTVTGTLSELRGRNISISAGTLTGINCDFDFSGLPDIGNTYIFLDINNLTTRLAELNELNLLPAGKLPDDLSRETGRITFRGTFSGFTTDFVTYGKLFTEAGTLTTDISFRPSGKNTFSYQGLLKGDAIEAGRLSGNSDLLGQVSFELNVDGVSRSLEDFSAVLDGSVDSAEINGYLYRDIHLSGNFTDRTWDGAISMNDSNLEFDFLGLLDFKKEIPEFDFSIHIPKAKLFYLNFDRADTASNANILMTANFSGNTIDNASGEIRLLNSTIERKGKRLDLYNALLTTVSEGESRILNLNSDFLDASINGKFNFGSLPSSLINTVARLVPSLYPDGSDRPEPDNENNFTLETTLLETDNLNDFLETGLRIASGSEIKLIYNSGINATTGASFKNLSFQNNTLTDVILSGEIKDTIASFSLNSKNLELSGMVDLAGFAVDISTIPDTISTVIGWDNKQKILNKGRLEIATIFSLIDTVRTTTFSVRPSDVWVRNDKWKINPSEIRFSQKMVKIDELLINSENDFYRISGIISDRNADSLKLDFEGIDLNFFNQIWDSGNKSQGNLHLALGGIMSGKVIVSGLLGEPMVETDNVVVEGFRMIDHEYGNVYINSVWDNLEKTARLELYNELNGSRAIDISGFYDPNEQKLSLEAKASELPVDILNPVLSSFASGIRGYATGGVRLSGSLRKPVLNGALFIRDGSMRVDYLQTQYSFSDSIRFNSKGILFSNINVSDDRNNIIRLNGLVSHNNFKNFGFDITFNPVQAKVLDTRQKDNDIFYGTAFATGVVAIRGSEGSISFDISARTDRNTRFFVPFNNSLSIGDYSFVTFASSDLPSTQINAEKGNPNPETEGSLSLNFDLDVTPDAEVQLVLDAKAGDVMRGRGSGKLNISLTPKGDFTISGDYIINSGDYLFTLGNIVNKRFNVDDGSRLSWNGDISDADIDIRARYRLETSLFDLLNDERFKDRIPVECLLHMTGKLLNPVIAFDINLPTADEQTRSYLRNAINTEEEMIRQFVYLLAISRFYPDPAFRGGSGFTPTTEAGMSAFGNTMEMLSNQITNMLSQISNDFDVGFVYRPGNEISAQEVEVALSTQILNDRVTINGNFDVGSNQANSTATTVTGVFDVEVAITDKLKFKFFNRSNDNLLYETSPYTQGIGIFFRHEFDSFRSFFRRKNAGEGKKEDEPQPVDTGK